MEQDKVAKYSDKRLNFEKLVPFFALLFFIVMAVKSTGYYHADEHYQIIEFAGKKLQTHTDEDMVWEYHHRIRPTLQPTIAYYVISIAKAVGWSNPYDQTLILRLLTAFFTFSVLLYSKHTLPQILKISVNRISYLCFIYFLWFIPFLSVRFGSETWSGILFLLGLTMYINGKHSNKKLLLSGLILGISFLFRYQIALCIFGLVMWIYFIDKAKLKTIFFILLGFLAAFTIGTLIDTWFYGSFTLAPYNFLLAVIETSGEGFGKAPWYYYLLMALQYPTYFVGIPLVSLLLIAFTTHYKNVFIWTTIPFLLFHFFVPHKELRFLFPIAYLLPPMILLGWAELQKRLKTIKIPKTVLMASAGFIVLLNFFILIVTSQKPAGQGRTNITEYIYNHYSGEPIQLIYSPWQNPFNPWNSLPQKFYSLPNTTYIQINTLASITDSLHDGSKINLLVIDEALIKSPADSLIIQNNGYSKVSQNMPNWVYRLMAKYRNTNSVKSIGLYELSSTIKKQ
ncbi:MAG: hypothetical protein R3279_05080 [Putridiphycobacter sp.]|nr:hypothetical protein [Putridiphycobacter sp.]